MCMVHVDVAVKQIEALFGWLVQGWRIADSPFAGAGSGITRFF